MAPNWFMEISTVPSVKRMRSPSGSMMAPSLSGSVRPASAAMTGCMLVDEGSGAMPPKVGSSVSRSRMSRSAGGSASRRRR